MRGAIRLARFAQRTYLRQRRSRATVRVRDFMMSLDPADWVEGGLLFAPQLWDSAEVGFLVRNLGPGNVFLDIGAHVGFSSLIASTLVGAGGSVVAIEANPVSFKWLQHNLRLNGARNVTALNLGVSDREGAMHLGVPERGTRAGSSLLSDSSDGVSIMGRPLEAVVRDQHIRKVDGAWIDICGSEYRVLKRYLAQVGRELYPRFLIMEDNPGWRDVSGGDPVTLLESSGYVRRRPVVRDPVRLRNCIMTLPQA
ncbi:MAG: FkbM family methyltransferase [Candidatus Binatus sp.]